MTITMMLIHNTLRRVTPPVTSSRSQGAIRFASVSFPFSGPALLSIPRHSSRGNGRGLAWSVCGAGAGSLSPLTEDAGREVAMRP